MPGGQDPLKNTGPVTEAGPKLTPRSAWPFTSAPVPPVAIVGDGGTTRANPLAASAGGLPVNVPPLSDMWQVMLDGRLLFGRGSGIGISAYTGLGLPDQRNSDVALPSEHGVVALGDYHTARQLVFNLCINARTLAGCDAATVGQSDDPAAAEAWDVLRYIAGVWQARTTDVLLEMRMTTGQSYMLLGRPRKFDADTTLLRKGQLAIAAEFIATDPRLYSVTLGARTLQLASPDDASLASFCLQAGTPVTPGGQPAQMVTPSGTAVQIGNGFSSSAGMTFWPLTSLVSGVAWSAIGLAAAATTSAAVSRIRANSGTEALPAGATTLTFGVQQFADAGPWGWAGQSFTPTADLDQMGRIKMGRTDGSVNIAWDPGTYLRLMDGATELARVTVPASGAGMPLELPFDYTFRAGHTYSVQINLPAPATVWTLSGIGGHSDGMYAFYSKDRIALPPFGVGTLLTPPATGDWTIKGSVRTGTNPLGQSLTLLRNGLPIANGWMAPANNGLAEFTTAAPVHFVPGDWLALVGLGTGNSNVTQLAAADGIAPGVTMTASGPAGTDPGGGFCTSQAPWGSATCAIQLPLLINGEGILTNRGNTDSLPIVTFFGPADHPTITNATTDRQLGLAYVLAAGEQVQVNMRTRQVFKGDAPTTPRYDLLATAADFWPLVPGENDVRLRQAGRLATAATLTWRDAWL